MASPAKKAKIHSKTKQYFAKQAQISNKKRNQLAIGDIGYLVIIRDNSFIKNTTRHKLNPLNR